MNMTNGQDRAARLQLFERWLRQLGVSRTTGWRWRREGLVTTLNIAGKIYVLDEEIERFTQRAQAGEFAKQPVVPSRSRVDASTSNTDPANSGSGGDASAGRSRRTRVHLHHGAEKN
jgi:hypothetical protein